MNNNIGDVLFADIGLPRTIQVSLPSPYQKRHSHGKIFLGLCPISVCKSPKVVRGRCAHASLRAREDREPGTEARRAHCYFIYLLVELPLAMPFVEGWGSAFNATYADVVGEPQVSAMRCILLYGAYTGHLMVLSEDQLIKSADRRSFMYTAASGYKPCRLCPFC